MTSSPPLAAGELVHPSTAEESKLALFSHLLEIDQHSASISEETEKSKDDVLRRKIVVEKEKDHFQKAALAVLDMLHVGDIS